MARRARTEEWRPAAPGRRGGGGGGGPGSSMGLLELPQVILSFVGAFLPKGQLLALALVAKPAGAAFGTEVRELFLTPAPLLEDPVQPTLATWQAFVDRHAACLERLLRRLPRCVTHRLVMDGLTCEFGVGLERKARAGRKCGASGGRRIRGPAWGRRRSTHTQPTCRRSLTFNPLITTNQQVTDHLRLLVTLLRAGGLRGRAPARRPDAPLGAEAGAGGGRGRRGGRGRGGHGLRHV
jgi:hypothetical protein